MFVDYSQLCIVVCCHCCLILLFNVVYCCLQPATEADITSFLQANGQPFFQRVTLEDGPAVWVGEREGGRGGGEGEGERGGGSWGRERGERGRGEGERWDGKGRGRERGTEREGERGVCRDREE